MSTNHESQGRNDSSRVISFSEENLREWFAQYDVDGEGISHAGFEKLCEQLGIESDQAPILMEELDADQDGKITFEDVFSKLGSQLTEQIDGEGQQDGVSPPVSPDPHESQQFFTPEARLNPPPNSLLSNRKDKPVQSTPLRSSLIYNRQRFGRWSYSGSPLVKSPQQGGTSAGESGNDLQFLSPIPTSPHHSRGNSNQDLEQDLMSMMSPFVEPTSPWQRGKRGSLISSDDDSSLWEDHGSRYGTAITGDNERPPLEAWSERQRSKSVNSLPPANAPHKHLSDAPHQFGPLNGLKQLLSPKAKEDESFFVSLDGMLEELELVGILEAEGKQNKDLLTVMKDMNMVSDGMVNLRSFLSTMDQYLSADTRGNPAYIIMKQIAMRAYKNEIRLLRRQVGELNTERETLRVSVSRMVEDKDKMATEVDIHHNELHEHTRHMLTKKQRKHEERLREVERSYQNEIEVIQENHRRKLSHLEQEKLKMADLQEKIRDDIKLGKMEIDHLQAELNRAHKDLQTREDQIQELMRLNSEHLDMVKLAAENENLKARLKELGKGEKLEELAQLQEQCKDLKDWIDELQHAHDTAQADLKKLRRMPRKIHILRQRETRLKEENQRLRDALSIANPEDTAGLSSSSPQSSSEQVRPSLASTISLDLPFDDREDDFDVPVEEDDDVDDDEGVERTEESISDLEEKSLHGEMHDLELKKARRSIMKLSSAKNKLTRDLEALHSEYQQFKEEERQKGEELREELDSKSTKCTELTSDLSSLSGEMDQVQLRLVEMSAELASDQSSHAARVLALEAELGQHGRRLESQRGTIASLEEELSTVESEKIGLLDSLDRLQEEAGQGALLQQQQLRELGEESEEQRLLLAEEVARLKQELKGLSSRNAQLTEDCSLLEERIAEQKDKLRQSDSMFKEMKGKIQEWASENQQLQHQRGTAEEDSKRLKEVELQLLETEEQLQLERGEHSQSRQDWEEEKQDLEEQLLRASEKCSNLEELCTDRQLSADTFVEEVTLLKRELEFLTQSKAEAAEQYQAEIDRCRAMMEAATILQKENSSLQGEVGRLGAALQRERVRLEESDSSHDQLVRSLQDEQDALLARLSRAEQEAAELGQRLEQLQQDKMAAGAAFEEETQELRLRVEELEAEVDQEEEELSVSQRERRQLESSLSSLETDFEKQVAALKAVCSAKDEEIEVLEERRSETETTLAAQKMEWAEGIADLESQLTAAHTDKYESEKSALSLQSQLQSLQDRLAAELSQVKGQHSVELRDQAEAVARERTRLEDQLRDSSTKLEEATARLKGVEASFAEEKARYSFSVDANTSNLSEQAKLFADKMAVMQNEVAKLTLTVTEQQDQMAQQEVSVEAERQRLSNEALKWREKESELSATVSELQQSLRSLTDLQDEDLESFKRSILLLEQQLTEKDGEVEELTTAKAANEDQLGAARKALLLAREELDASANETKVVVVGLERDWEERRAEWDHKRRELESGLTSAREEASGLTLQLSASVPASSLTEQKDQLTEVTSRLQSAEAALSAREAALKHLKRESKRKEDDHHRMMDALGAQVDNMAVEVKQQSSYVTSLRTQLDAEQLASNKLQEELKFMNDLVGEMDREKDAQEEFDSFRAAAAQKESDLREELRKRLSLIHTLEISVDTKEDLLAEKQKRIAQLLSRVEVLECEAALDLPGLEDSPPPSVGRGAGPGGVATLSQELQRERRLSQELQTKVTDLESSFTEDMERERRLSSSQVAELESELSVLKERASSSSVLVQDLRKKLAHTESTMKELSTDLNSFKSTLEERDVGYEEGVQNYKHRMSELEEYIEELKSQNQATSKQFEELVEYNEILEDDNHMLREELDHWEATKRTLCSEMETYAEEKEAELAGLKDKLAAAEFSLAEGELCNPTTVRELEEELQKQKDLLEQERERVKQLTEQLPSGDVPHIMEGEESVDAGSLSVIDHETKLNEMEKTYKKDLDCLHEEVACLKEELQGLQDVLKSRSLTLDDSLDQKAVLSRQLKEINEDRELLSSGLKKHHDRLMVEIGDRHSKELKALLREKKEMERSHKQREELLAQLLQQTVELNEGKTRLSKTIRELREERESLFNIIENLASKIAV